MSHVSIRDPPRIVSNRERTTNIYDGGNLPNDKLSQTTYESLTRTYAKKKRWLQFASITRDGA